MLEPGAKFPIRVVTRAGRRGIVMSQDGTLVVRVTEPPEGGRANAAVLKALAKHFAMPHRRLRIAQGQTSRQKLIEVV